MSLIEEALRRIQDPLLAKHDARAPAPHAPPQAAAPPGLRPAGPEAPPPATQDERRAGAPIHSWQASPPPLPQLPSAQSSVNPLLAVSFSVLTLTAVIIISGAFWIGHHVVMRPTQVEISQSAGRPRRSESRPAPAAQPAAAVTETPETSNGLTLSGVVEGMGESYAVINGLIVGAGEQVGGATVLEVAGSAVKLRRADGDEIVLNVPR